MSVLSPMLRAPSPRRNLTAIFLALMFIFADLAILEYHESADELADNKRIDMVSATYRPIAETHIADDDPSVNFANADNSKVGQDFSSQARALISFANSYTTADSIISATLHLQCREIFTIGTNDVKAYAASTELIWRASESTWVDANSTTPWSSPGADGTLDRGGWETPATTTSTINPIVTNYSFNVTYLVQQDIFSGNSDFSFLISALGGMLECAKDSNATAAYKPVLHIESQNQPHGPGASAVADFAEDGMPLMSNNFILAAETLPTLSYNSLVGEGVEFQLSLSDDFRDVEDLDWVYSTMDDPFTTTSTTGSYTIPATDELTNGTVVNYRYRAVDNTSKLSDWTLGNFLLPGLDVVDNRDGSATMVLYASDLNLTGYTLIEDAAVNSALNFADGSNSLLTFANSPTSESLIHTRLNLQYLGISSTSTILDAKLILTRSNNLPNAPMLSMHTMSNTAWVENEVTWNLEQNGVPWNSGGKDSLGRATDTGISGAQTNSNFEFDFQHLLESEVSNGIADSLEFTINGLTDSQLKPTTNEVVEFFAKEDLSANSPRIYIKYEPQYNGSVPNPILESPINGEPVWKLNGHNLSGDETPDLVWNATSSPTMGVIFQLANDSLFRDIIVENDARTQTPMLSSQGQFSIPQVSALDKGKEVLLANVSF